MTTLNQIHELDPWSLDGFRVKLTCTVMQYEALLTEYKRHTDLSLQSIHTHTCREVAAALNLASPRSYRVAHADCAQCDMLLISCDNSEGDQGFT